MHYLVTGGGGFLGRYVVEHLIARGDQVRSFGRGAYPELETLGVEVIRGDLRDREAVQAACNGVDCVIHSGAVSGIGVLRKEFFEINLGGTENVLSACRRSNVRRLVYTSSPSVTFDGSDQHGADESAPYPRKWLAHYPHSKALAEQAVLQANDRGGLRTCALRPHLIWGPRDGHLVPRLIVRAQLGKLRRVGDGSNLVDTIYVENAAEAHLQAADSLADEHSPVAGRALFLSQGEPINCWQWIDEILALADLPPVEKSISLAAATRVGAVFESAYRLLRIGKEPPMTHFLAAQLARSHWFDISAARRDLGYHPRISTAEGMRRLGEWLRSRS